MADMRLIHLLIPDELRNQLTEKADQKGNSLSAEIRERLYASLSEGKG